MCNFSVYVAFNKAKNGQTDVKHEKEKQTSLNVTVEDCSWTAGSPLPRKDRVWKWPLIKYVVDLINVGFTEVVPILLNK